MAHKNEDLLRKFDGAMQSGDMATFWGLMTDDVVLHVSGRSALAGDHKGKETAQKLFAKWMELSGTMTLTTHDIVAGDTHGFILQTSRAERGGKIYEGNGVAIAHFRDGKVAELFFIDEDSYRADEFYK